MQFVSEEIVRLEPIFKRNGNPTNESKIFIKGHSVNYILDGIVLDECIEIYSYYLLIVSYRKKNDKKDGLFIYLLSKDGDFLEEARVKPRVFNPIILPVGTDEYEADLDSYWGYLKNIKLIPPNKVTFRFADNFWELEIFESLLYSWALFFLGNIDEGDEPIPIMRPSWQYKTYFKFIMG